MKNSLKTIINGLKTWVIDRLDFNKLKNRPFYEDVENNVIVPMDKKFLPEHQHSWEGLEDKPFYNYEEVLFEADSVTSEYHTWEMGTYKFIPLLDFKLGETIFVNLDGTTYEKTVVEVVEQSTGTSYIGLDFTSDFNFNQCGIFSDNLNIDLENAYVKIYRKNLKQIDEKVIPDSIARTEDIPTVPTTLPNPNALTFTGAVEETYDGSVAKTIDIPMGGGVDVTYDEEKEAIIFGASSGSSSGGSEKEWKLINTITLEEDVTNIEIDTDSEGDPFDLEELIVIIKGHVSDNQSERIMGWFDTDKNPWSSVLYYNKMLYSNNNYSAYCHMKFNRVTSKVTCDVIRYANEKVGGTITRTAVDINTTAVSNVVKIMYGFASNETYTVLAGTTITLYGR